MASLPARAALVLIRAYQLSLAAFTQGACRHSPSCSHFAADAIRAHGAWAGGWMAAARIWRCRPGGSHGWDPAPERRPAAPWWRPWRYGDWRGGYRAPPESLESLPHDHDHAA